MTLEERTALKIPAEFRREILLLNAITKAVPSRDNEFMKHLVIVYKNYIQPDLSLDCPRCYERVLSVYKSMLDTMVRLEKESTLLKEI